jgi:RNA recognition motif-containing protein
LESTVSRLHANTTLLFLFSANETFINDVFSSEGMIEINEYNGKPKIKIYQDHGVSKGECTISFVDESTAQKVVGSMNGESLFI